MKINNNPLATRPHFQSHCFMQPRKWTYDSSRCHITTPITHRWTKTSDMVLQTSHWCFKLHCCNIQAWHYICSSSVHKIQLSPNQETWTSHLKNSQISQRHLQQRIHPKTIRLANHQLLRWCWFAGSWTKDNSTEAISVHSWTGYTITFAGCRVLWTSKL